MEGSQLNWSNRKLLNCDLYHLNHRAGHFYYKEILVDRLEVLGQIILYENRNDFLSFKVDDGTAVLSCTLYKNVLPENATNAESNLFGAATMQPVLGELCRVTGKYTLYRDQPRLIVYSYEALRDPNALSLHKLLQVRLYKQFYDVKQSERQRQKSHSVKEVGEEVLAYLRETGCEQCVEDVAQAPNLVKLLSGTTQQQKIKLIKCAVAEFCNLGVISEPTSGFYRAVDLNAVDKGVLSALQKEAVGCEGGLHYRRVWEAMRHHSRVSGASAGPEDEQFRGLSVDVIRASLGRLEERSLVYSTINSSTFLPL